jgi:hypothetical protein
LNGGFKLPTIQDIVKRNKQLLRGASGAVEERPTDTVQKLAGQVGLPQTPDGAVGTYLIGGNINQQKMAGTPQQQQGSRTLEETVRRGIGQERVTETTEEQKKRQLQEKLQPLSESQKKAQELIDSKVQGLATVATGAVASAQAGTEYIVRSLATGENVNVPTDVEKLNSLKTNLDKYQANPSDMAALREINLALGRDINSQLDPTSLESILETTTDATISRAQTLPDNILIKDVYSRLGISTPLTEIAGSLGIDPNKLDTMTVTEFEPFISDLARLEFERAKGLEQQMGTPGLMGSAELASAQSMGRELARTGVRASEAAMGRLERAVQDADQVEFGGKVHTIGDILSDENVSRIVSDYINSPEGSATRTELEKSEPEFVKFINKYREALEYADKAQEVGIGNFKEIQETNQGLVKGLDTKILGALDSELVDSKGKLALKSEVIDPEKEGGILAAVNAPEANSQQITTAANAIAQMGDPNLTSQLGGLSKDEALQLRTDDVREIADARAVRAELQHWEETGNEDEILKYFSGMDSRQLQSAIDRNNWAANIFGITGSNFQYIQNPDGSRKQVGEILSQIKSGITPEVTVKGAISNSIVNPKSVKGEIVDVTSKLDADKSEILKEVMQRGPSEISEDSAWKLKDMGIGVAPDATGNTVKQGLFQAVQRAEAEKWKRTQELISKFRPVDYTKEPELRSRPVEEVIQIQEQRLNDLWSHWNTFRNVPSNSSHGQNRYYLDILSDVVEESRKSLQSLKNLLQSDIDKRADAERALLKEQEDRYRAVQEIVRKRLENTQKPGSTSSRSPYAGEGTETMATGIGIATPRSSASD